MPHGIYDFEAFEGFGSDERPLTYDFTTAFWQSRLQALQADATIPANHRVAEVIYTVIRERLWGFKEDITWDIAEPPVPARPALYVLEAD